MPFLSLLSRATSLISVQPTQSRDTTTAVIGALKENGVHLLGPADRPEAADVIARSFAGTPASDPEWAIHWILGPALQDRDDPQRVEILRFLLASELVSYGTQAPMSLLPLLPGPAALKATPAVEAGVCASDGRITLLARNAEGKIEAVVVAQRMTTPAFGVWSDVQSLSSIVRVVWSRIARIPSSFLSLAMLRDIVAPVLHRGFSIVYPKVNAGHHKLIPHEHWYVHYMAVAPEAQGKGHCGRLMRAVNNIADAEGLPLFLVCTGDKNRRVYERFGYKTVGTYDVNDKGDSKQEWSLELPCFFMLRPRA
mmetsp:Transcript_7864/g.21440  ORF Transcript_7864/g.21440 Transcript_7864/m.21440 type:complete len:310 (-) Transcript_7864:181-1110(-)